MNTWRAEAASGNVEFRSSDFDEYELEAKLGLPIKVIDVTDGGREVAVILPNDDLESAFRLRVEWARPSSLGREAWAQRTRRAATGALLVAPADVDSPRHTPDEVRSFSPIPMARLPFPSVVVASSDDPFVALERATAFAAAWGSRLVTLPRGGHINADAGFGPWPEGRRLLDALVAGGASTSA